MSFLILNGVRRCIGASAPSSPAPSSSLLLSFDSGTTGDSDYITTSWSSIFEGGFLLDDATHGAVGLNYSGRNRIAKGSTSSTIFTTGYDDGASGNHYYGEFNIPTLVNDADVTTWNVGSIAQDFRDIELDFTVPHENPVITGLYYDSNSDNLLIGATNYYGTPGDTGLSNMMRVDGASDLATASRYGMFRMDGEELSGGYGCEIPSEHQTGLGGTHIFGGLCGGQIITRLCNGPAAYVANISDLTSATLTTDTPAATAALSYPYDNDTMLSMTEGLWNDGISKMGNDWLNGELDYVDNASRSAPNYTDHSDVWNHLSWLASAFFIPGTRTLMGVGVTGGLVSNIRYGDYDDTASYIGAYFPYDHTDYANYYWLFDVDDLIAAIADPITNPPHRIRPYQYGVITGLPILAYNREITGAYFDTETNRIIMSVQRGGTDYHGQNTPAFLVCDLTSELS